MHGVDFLSCRWQACSLPGCDFWGQSVTSNNDVGISREESQCSDSDGWIARGKERKKEEDMRKREEKRAQALVRSQRRGKRAGGLFSRLNSREKRVVVVRCGVFSHSCLILVPCSLSRAAARVGTTAQHCALYTHTTHCTTIRIRGKRDREWRQRFNDTRKGSTLSNNNGTPTGSL